MNVAVALEMERRRRARAAELADEAGRLADDYRAFIRAAWPVIEPGTPLVGDWYIDAIADHLAALAAGQILALMIHIRPRMGKTNLCSVLLGGWMWARDPTRRLLWASYGEDRRDEDSRRTRALVLSDWYQARWPLQLAADQRVKHRFALAAGGYRYSAIYGSGTTGDGGDILGLDDPQNAADQYSPTDLERDHLWYYQGWQTRRNAGDLTPELLVMQRLGPGDLAGRLRYDEPNRWQVLGLQTRRTAVPVATYWRGEKTISLPLIDTALSRSGAFADPRQVGELLSGRVGEDGAVNAERNQPSVWAAQDQQAPVQASAEGAKVHEFTRAKNVRSFATRMGTPDLRSAIALALRSGWRATAGLDHGTDARREVCVILLWSQRDREMWVVGVYANTTRTTPEQDALGIRALLDTLGMHPRLFADVTGDVGSLGKAAAEDVARSINVALGSVKMSDGSPVLGWIIGLPDKRPGSVDRGVEILNVAFGGGMLMVDESCGQLATAIENWTGGEAWKDFIDALRYGARYRLEGWQIGPGGVQ